MALQTPKQRAANAKFAKIQEKKQGKPRNVKQKEPLAVSRTWLAVLAFLVFGGAILELLRLVF